SSLRLSGGTLNLNGQSDAIANLNNSGATVLINGVLTVGSMHITGGTTIIGPDPRLPLIARGTDRRIHISRDDAVVTSRTTAPTDIHISDGTVLVKAGGAINVGSGGMFLEEGTGASSVVTLNRDSVNPGKINLGGDLTDSRTDGTASIIS